MSEPSSSRNPSPEPKLDKKVKRKRKSIVDEVVEEKPAATSDEAAAKAEKKLKKRSKKAPTDTAADESMAVDAEADAVVVEVKVEKKSKKKSKDAVSELVEAAMEVDIAADEAVDNTKADKKLKRKRKEATEEKADEGADSDAAEGASGSEAEGEGAPEVPVLSHAERRKRKKEAKLAAKLKGDESEDEDDAEGGEATTKKRKLKDGSAKAVDSTVKRKNSVWVGNMSFKTQQENLKAFFDGVGEITRINMPTKPPAGPGVRPENRGFAYVDFATPEAKAIAIALSENPLLGRKLLIKDGDDFAGRPAAVSAEHATSDPVLAHKTHSKTAQKILRAQKQPPAATLFFGNLPFDTTDDTIRELLDAHRPHVKKSKDAGAEEAADEKPKDVWIRKVRMGTFEDTGACKGFAFVDFMTTDHATSALINPRNHHLNGRSLVVEYASPDAVRRGAPKGKGDGVFKGSRAARPDRPERTWGDRPPRNTEGQEQDAGGEGGAEGGDTAGGEEAPKRAWEHKERPAQLNSEGRHKGPRSRPKPGAALALAKRESVAIVPSQGQKITF